MKKLFFIIVLGCSFVSSAQAQQHRIAFSAGYLGHLFVTPGARIGASIPLKTWGKKRPTTPSLKVNHSKPPFITTLFIHPHLGFFVVPKYNTNMLLQSDVGFRWQRLGGLFSFAVSLGLGYEANFEITSVKVHVNRGPIDETWERRDYFLTSFNAELGVQFLPMLGCYAKVSSGMTFSLTREGAFFLLMDLGVKVFL